MKYPTHLTKLIEILKKLPGVGNKSAERYAFDLIQWNASELHDMGTTIGQTHQKLRHCATCGCLSDGEDPCQFCTDDRKTKGHLCIISSPRDVFSIEETREFTGTYHVLNCLLSPMEGKGPERLQIGKLKNRIYEEKVQEIVIALDATLEGDATSLYLKRELEECQVKISRLAFGLPMGSSLDYVDGGTLARAFSGRNPF